MNRPVLTVALVAAVTLLSACSSVADRVGQVQQEAGKALLPQIAIGECTNLEFPEGTDSSATTSVAEIEKVDCAQPHKWETFAEKQLPLADEYPGDSGMSVLADDFCAGEFEGFVGTAYDNSEIELTYLTPTAEGWSQLRDRTITCLVGSDAGDITGTLKGTQR